MSMGNEIAAETEADFAVFEGKIEQEAKEGIWTTKDGRRIPITEMSDRHIENTIRMLERNDTMDVYYPWVVRLKKELERRR